jgi:hypothetical protein
MAEPSTKPTYPITWQFCRNGYDITDQFYAEDDADTVRAWTGDFCLAEICRDPTTANRWRVHTSDLAQVPDEVYVALHRRPSGALKHLAEVCQFTYATEQPDEN